MMNTHAPSPAHFVSPLPEAPHGARAWLWRLVATPDEAAPAVARLVLGLVIFPHAAQKVFGWFGGYGLAGTLGFFTQRLGIPRPLAILAIAAEALGTVGLVTGTLSRVAALGILGVMAFAVGMVHIPNGFFMNWTGAQMGEGFEYHLLAMALAVVVMIDGAGAASIDRLLARGIERPRRARRFLSEG